MAKTVFNLIILDETGSMQAIKEATVRGFNEVVQTIQLAAKKYPEQAQRACLVTFNAEALTNQLWNADAADLTELTAENYRPRAMTPLHDAMGFSMAKLRDELVGQSDYQVLVTVITDGEENASREYTGATVKKLAEELQQGNWTVTFIGANQDAYAVGQKLGVQHSANFLATDAGTAGMFQREASSRMAFYQKASRAGSVKPLGGYFDEEKPEGPEIQ